MSGAFDSHTAAAGAEEAPIDERVLASGPRFDFDRLRADVEALAAMQRGSAAESKPHVEFIERRLREAGAHEIRTESFRFQRRPWRHVAHGVAGVGATAVGGPLGTGLLLATAFSLEGEAGAHSRWSARFLPAGKGVNVAARIPAAGEPERTVVFVAHHDTQRAGLMWRMAKTQTPYALPAQVALVIAATGCAIGSRILRLLGGLFGAVATLLALDLARSHPVPGANDNATGVAATLALAAAFARDPLERADVVVLLTDCEEVGQGGIAAWVEAHRSELDPARTIVVGLDTLGCGEPVVVTRDGALTAVYSETGRDWADRGALRAAVSPPRRGALIAPTDPIVAQHAGLLATSILSFDERGTLGPHYHLPSDTPENVDWHSVEQCTRLAAGIARVWDSAS